MRVSPSEWYSVWVGDVEDIVKNYEGDSTNIALVSFGDSDIIILSDLGSDGVLVLSLEPPKITYDTVLIFKVKLIFEHGYSIKREGMIFVFHISKQNLHGKKLYPRIPDNYMTRHGYEENKTPRVCFSETIDGCLIALGQNIPIGTKYYVFEPDGKYNIIPNSIVKKLVPDAHITKEVWITEPVKLRLIDMIEVTGYDDNPNGYEYRYGKNKEHKAVLYGWSYKRLGVRPTSFK